MDLLYEVLRLAAVLLMPVLPAILVYRAIPGTIEVNGELRDVALGPLKGTKLKMTGGFAGYFLLVILAIKITPPVQPDFVIWTATGTVDIADPADTAAIPTLSPLLWNLDHKTGKFWIIYPVQRSTPGAPSLTLTAPNQEFVTIPLEPDSAIHAYKLNVDSVGHKVTITGALPLRSFPPYKPQQLH